MPYKSEAQRRYFHAAASQGKISPKTVKDFDEASKGLKLPDKVGAKKKITSVEQLRAIAKKKNAV